MLFIWVCQKTSMSGLWSPPKHTPKVRQPTVHLSRGVSWNTSPQNILLAQRGRLVTLALPLKPAKAGLPPTFEKYTTKSQFIFCYPSLKLKYAPESFAKQRGFHETHAGIPQPTSRMVERMHTTNIRIHTATKYDRQS